MASAYSENEFMVLQIHERQWLIAVTLAIHYLGSLPLLFVESEQYS